VRRLREEEVVKWPFDLDEVEVDIGIHESEVDKAISGGAGLRVVILNPDILEHGDVLGKDKQDEREDFPLPFLFGSALRGAQPFTDRVTDEKELRDLGL